MATEFSIIEQYFKTLTESSKNIDLGIGDDGAIITPPPLKQLVVVTDSSIIDVHFPKNTPAYAIAWKSLAVNLSDLAAMGAEPAFFSLALSLPNELNNNQWLSDFSKGLKTLADKYNLSLIGGDTTKSAILSITITAHGWLDSQQAMLRSGAKKGDLIFVSGSIGDGGVGLKNIGSTDYKNSINKLNMPEPRVKLGLELSSLVNSCIDISDGLLVDLNHILEASSVGAVIDYDAIPLSSEVQHYIDTTKEIIFPLTCGDDYELCFTISADKVSSLKNLGTTCIGKIIGGGG